MMSVKGIMIELMRRTLWTKLLKKFENYEESISIERRIQVEDSIYLSCIVIIMIGNVFVKLN